MGNLTATLALSTTDVYTLDVYTLDLWMREDGLRVDRVLLVTDTTYTPNGIGPAASPLQTITNTMPTTFSAHVIQYTYDDLYRLTDAVYNGPILSGYG